MRRKQFTQLLSRTVNMLNALSAINTGRQKHFLEYFCPQIFLVTFLPYEINVHWRPHWICNSREKKKIYGTSHPHRKKYERCGRNKNIKEKSLQQLYSPFPKASKISLEPHCNILLKLVRKVKQCQTIIKKVTTQYFLHSRGTSRAKSQGRCAVKSLKQSKHSKMLQVCSGIFAGPTDS